MSSVPQHHPQCISVGIEKKNKVISHNVEVQRGQIDAQSLTVVSFPSWISRSIVVSFPSHFWCCTSLPFSKVMTVLGRDSTITVQHKQGKVCILASLGKEEMTHLGVPAIRSSLLELFVQLELDLCSFERALSLQGYEAVVSHTEHQVGFHHVAHLPGCKVHT